MARTCETLVVDQEISEKRKNDQMMIVSESDAEDVRSVPRKEKEILETAIVAFEESDQSVDETPVVVLSEVSNLKAHNNEVVTSTVEEIQEHGKGHGTSEEPQPENPTAHPEETDGQAQMCQEDDDDEEILFTQLEEAKEYVRTLMWELRQ